jgi:hypothetical protein
MIYKAAYYEETSYRSLLIDVLSSQHEAVSLNIPERSYWNRFDTDYLENTMVKFSTLLK